MYDRFPMRQRRQISISPRIEEMARTLMAQGAFDDLSGFLSQLIRDEYDRRIRSAAPITSEVASEPTSDDPAVIAARDQATAAAKRRVLREGARRREGKSQPIS